MMKNVLDAGYPIHCSVIDNRACALCGRRDRDHHLLLLEVPDVKLTCVGHIVM